MSPNVAVARPKTRLAAVSVLLSALTVSGTVLVEAGAQAGTLTTAASSSTTTLTTRAVRDTVVAKARPATSYGRSHTLRLGRGRQGLVAFSMPATPAGTTLQSGSVCVVPTRKAHGRVVVFTAGSGWSETTTWRSRPVVTGKRLGASHGRLRKAHRSCVSVSRAALVQGASEFRLASTRRGVRLASRELKAWAPTLTLRFAPRADEAPAPGDPTATPTDEPTVTPTDEPTTAAPTTAAPTTAAPTTASPPQLRRPQLRRPLLRPRRLRPRRLRTTAAPTTAAPTTSAPDLGIVNHLVVGSSALEALPMNGTGWTTLLSTANGSTGSVNLADQNNTNAGRVLASALVYARTGNASYRDKVVGQLKQVDASTLTDARVLSVARQLAGYAMAADLVGYRDPAFVSFMSGMRTRYIGNHGAWTALTQTSEVTANNWGAWALTSRIAIDIYVGDDADLARSAKVFRGFLGDAPPTPASSATADFDASYACGSLATWVPINPAGCGDKDGAIVEDISRTARLYPTIDDTGRTYSWEVLGARDAQRQDARRSGYGGVWQWSDKALLRAASSPERHGGYAPRYTKTSTCPGGQQGLRGGHGPVNPAGHGRQFGFTDWLP